MIHVKNISIGEPKTMADYQLSKHAGVMWLYSEDGQNWYEVQKHFRVETLKVAYARDGGVACLSYDVSAINPIGLSVIEIENNTANRQIDLSGYWFYRDGKFIFDYALKAEDERNILLSKVSSKAAEWEKDLLLRLISDEDRENLKEYRFYAKSLQAMEFSAITDKTSYNAIKWPVSPEISS